MKVKKLFSLDSDLVTLLEQKALQMKMNMSDIVAQALISYLNLNLNQVNVNMKGKTIEALLDEAELEYEVYNTPEQLLLLYQRLINYDVNEEYTERYQQLLTNIKNKAHILAETQNKLKTYMQEIQEKEQVLKKLKKEEEELRAKLKKQEEEFKAKLKKKEEEFQYAQRLKELRIKQLELRLKQQEERLNAQREKKKTKVIEYIGCKECGHPKDSSIDLSKCLCYCHLPAGEISEVERNSYFITIRKEIPITWETPSYAKEVSNIQQ